MVSCNKMGLPPYYGNISATIIGYFVSLLICLYVLHKKFDINYEKTLREFVNILFSTIVMTAVILLLRLLLPTYSLSRVMNIPIICCYTIVGAVVYFILVYKTNTLKHIFGEEALGKIKKRLKKSK